MVNALTYAIDYALLILQNPVFLQVTAVLGVTPSVIFGMVCTEKTMGGVRNSSPTPLDFPPKISNAPKFFLQNPQLPI
jgi:hypothetical protein